MGFAPADKPEVALSVRVTNRGPWRVKGMHVAADMLRVYFADHGVKGVRHPPSFKGPKRRKKPKAPDQKGETSQDESEAPSS